jgi:hypothetical protein
MNYITGFIHCADALNCFALIVFIYLQLRSVGMIEMLEKNRIFFRSAVAASPLNAFAFTST